MISAFAASAIAQQTAWPDGVYYTVDEFKAKTPRARPVIGQIERTENDIKWGGGSGYFFYSDDDEIKDRHINRDVMFVVFKSKVYLNTRIIERGKGYAECLTQGTFLVMEFNTTDATAANTAGVLFGAIGAAIAVAATPVEFTLYVHSLRTGNSRFLTREYLEARMADHPDLLKQWNDDVLGYDVPSKYLMIKYINLLNERLDK